ncbi:MAG: asparagine synthase (glutamine-hydrolyzing) [Alphaproteobacteria bacterium]|nr:asparagine synthase (glutamine-hydrolyzing) [Alphaproteobacteria bacterium]
MCGIAGYLNLDGAPASETVAQDMAAMLDHRGPDDAGRFADGAVAFGHTRLSIIDLSAAGHQPMTTEDGRYTITYNGEIYNFRELRRELEQDGVSFRSRSDTEVLLKAFARWGEAVVARLNGMFAFAVWDSRDARLFLARDRYGVKPLYMGRAGNTVLFASEIKAFLPHPAYAADIDTEGLVEYFAFQNYFTDRTLFRDVRMFPAGHYQWIDGGRGWDGLGAQVQYWDYSFAQPEKPRARADYIEELDRLFVQAVERQLVSDVEVGSYLSGGMDSGSITAVASRDLVNLKTFTVGFDLHSASGLELVFDEREKAELMSYRFGTEHYEMVLKAGDMERCMRRLTWHLEEPRVGQSYPNFYAANLAGRFCKVVLAGAGGDELFGGYPWRYYRAVVNDDFPHYVDKYFSYWQRLLPAELLEPFLRPLGAGVRDVDLRGIFAGVFKSHADALTTPQEYVNHSLYFEAKTFLHGLLTVEDKLSMAHGLESRVPFLDNDLVDFACRVPVEMKLGNLRDVVAHNENEPGRKTQRYFQKTQDGKLLLRDAMRRYIPDEIAENVKQGFSAPDASWFKGESIDYVRKRLMGRDAGIFEFVDRDTVHSLVEDHLQGRENRRLLIWSLLSIEEWIETFLNQRTADVALAMGRA